MPVYSLDGRAPTLPDPGRFWIAPGAHVIGNRPFAPWTGGYREPAPIRPQLHGQLASLRGWPATLTRRGRANRLKEVG